VDSKKTKQWGNAEKTLLGKWKGFGPVHIIIPTVCLSRSRRYLLLLFLPSFFLFFLQTIHTYSRQKVNLHRWFMGRDSLVSEHASLFCIGKWREERYGSGTGNTVWLFSLWEVIFHFPKGICGKTSVSRTNQKPVVPKNYENVYSYIHIRTLSNYFCFTIET